VTLAAMDHRLVCAALTAFAAAIVAIRPGLRAARALWLALWVAGALHILLLCLLGSSLPGSNLSHYYLGAKYPLPYAGFYRLIQAARDEPPIGIRDLEHPASRLGSDPRARRMYYIDLLRAQRVPFDALAPLDSLERIAERSGAVSRESEQLLRQTLPAARIAPFRHDVAVATAAANERPLTDDFGYNGSPFYAVVRHADPSLYFPLGRATAVLGIVWQILGAVLLVWIAGEALGLETHERMAAGALLFASADFAVYVAPGLVFNELWLPVALAALAVRRRRWAAAGVAIAFAGLIKLFPFVLLLPAGVELVRQQLRKRGGEISATAMRPARLLTACALASAVFALASLVSGRTWMDFLRKVMIEFQAGANIVNSVSLTALLHTFLAPDSPLPILLAILALCVLSLLFVERRAEVLEEALARRMLVLISAVGWLSHSWLNYYALVPCLLFPWYARRHRIGTALAIVAMAAAFLRPGFGDAQLLSQPLYHPLKILPYLLIPAWMVVLELQAKLNSGRARRVVAIGAVAVVLAIAADAWRSQAIRGLTLEGRQRLNAGEADRALESYRRLGLLSPRNGDARMHEAIALATLGRMNEAVPVFVEATSLMHANPVAEANCGRALLLAGRADEATVHFNRALDLTPWDTNILELLAEARTAQGRRTVADSLLARAQELDPDDAGIKAARQHLLER
jgi:tetratricopeptide (TPR) repeat protein